MRFFNETRWCTRWSQPGPLALGTNGRGGQPDRRHEITPGQLCEDLGVDLVGLAGERSESFYPQCVGDLDAPPVELEGVVDETRPVHRLDDGVHLLAERCDASNEMGKPIRVGGKGLDGECLAGIVQHMNIDPAS
jgi:hypothetical protein